MGKSLSATVRAKANLIWSVADKLTGVYKPHEYGEVILPLTVLKRFDEVLSDTKDEVVEAAQQYKETFAQRDMILKSISGQNFYNTSKYDFKKLLDEPDKIEEHFNNYLRWYSKEVQDIMRNFKLPANITKMADNKILYRVIETFNSKEANLHPDEVSNIEMGYIFEEIIRRFSEAHNEDAGQHYTPREVIKLMVSVVFSDDEDLADAAKIKTVYDWACGTGWILSAAMEYANQLNSSSEMMVYGQELNEETYAICKADMLIKWQEQNNIRKWNTLSEDLFPGEKFDYIMMNPPFWREWKNEKTAVEKEAKLWANWRFPVGTPGISDSQLLFLMNAVSKMKSPEEWGSKIAIIHNGSALFKWDAESWESEIRRYVIENHLLDCIIQLPTELFYNTWISTYIWVLSNKKPEHRKGKVQLIDASSFFQKMTKSLWYKRNEITDEQIEQITKIYWDFVNSKYSKINDEDFFWYHKVSLYKPARKSLKVSEDLMNFLQKIYTWEMKNPTEKADYEFALNTVMDFVWSLLYYSKKEMTFLSVDEMVNNVLENNKQLDTWISMSEKKMLKTLITTLFIHMWKYDDNAELLYDCKWKLMMNDCFSDTEIIPFQENEEEYMDREVRPFVKWALIDEKKTKVWYEIPFTKCFYKYQEPRRTGDILNEIVELDKKLDWALNELRKENE